MVLVSGGARSGKSEFAEGLAAKNHKKILYIATAIPFDLEMKERIEIHKKRRSKKFTTYEGFFDIDILINEQKEYDCVLIDCLTIMITNLFFHFAGDNQALWDYNEIQNNIITQMERLANACKESKTQIILVTNEVGLGIVPENKLSRVFRDIAGTVNQIFAKKSLDVYFLVSGIPMKVKGDR